MSMTKRPSILHSAFCILHCVLCIAFSASAAENIVSNGNFEACGSFSGYKENVGATYLIGWTCSSGCGISMPSGTYISSNIRNYDNSAWAFLKNVSSFEQDVTIPEAGDYILEFDFAGRPGHLGSANTKVTFGGKLVRYIEGDGGSSNGSVPAHFATPLTAVSAGTYTLKFAQTVAGDISPAFDNISLSKIENRLVVTGNPAAPGKPSPDYGTHYSLDACTASAPAAYTNSAKTAIYQCAGWKLFTLNGGGDWVLSTSGQGNSFEYSPPAAGGVCKIEWQWSPSYLVSASAGAGGTAEVDGVASNWYARGATCTFSATPASPSVPTVWTGNQMPIGMAPADQTFTTHVYAPMALKANFTDVLWVDDDAGSGGTGTFTAPYQTVQDAISAASAGKCVAVMPGQYQLNGTKTISSAITITGVTADFNDATIAAANGARQAVKIQSAEAVLRNLTLKGTGGTANGVVALTKGLLENCRVTNGSCSRQGKGAGVCNEGGTVRRCTIDGNTATGNIFDGLGLFQSSGLAEYCVITNNKYTVWHGSTTYLCPAGAFVSGGTLRGCLIARNSPGACNESQTILCCALGLGLKGSPVIDGCAVVDNYTGSTIAGYPTRAVYVGEGNPSIRNIIVQNNTDAAGADLAFGGHSPIYYSLLASGDGVSGVGNRFEQANTYIWTNGLFKLQPLSMAIGSAIGAGGADYGLDIYGKARIQEGAMEMGPAEYEEGQEVEADIAIRVDSTNFEIPATNAFSSAYAGFPQGGVTYAWKLNGETVSTSSEWRAEWLTAGVYEVALVVTSRDGTVTVSKSISVTAFSRHLFLDASCATPSYPYATRETAAKRLADIRPLILSGGSLTIYPGTYTSAEQLSFSFPYEVRGIGGRDRIVIQRTGSGRNVSFTSSGGYVCGVTFKGGSSAAGATMYLTGGALAEDVNLFGGSPSRNDANGGGGCLYIENATIRDSTIGNVSSSQDIGYGIGAKIKAGALVDRCIITNVVCTTMHLADMHAQGIAVHMTGGILRNSLIAGNKATSSNTSNGKRYAIGVYQTGGSIENCTIADNQFRYSSASQIGPCGYYRHEAGTMTNSIVFGNISTDTSAGTNTVWNIAGTADAAMSHCYTNDPAFFRDQRRSKPYYGIQPLSPCVNVGALLSWMDDDATDLAGAKRVANRIPDIGCYETPAPAGTIILAR